MPAVQSKPKNRAPKKSLPKRRDVPEEHTWDLKQLFRSDAAWEKAYEDLESRIAGYEKFRGQLGKSAKKLRECWDYDVAFDRLAEKLGSYAFLKSSQDVADAKAQAMIARYTYVATRAMEAASFIAPEIQALPEKTLKAYMASKELEPFRYHLEKLIRYKPHILSPNEERLLAMQGEVAGSASKIFGQLTDADFKFGTVKDEKGRNVELTQGSFRVFMESPSRSVRKEAFQKFYAVFDGHKNGLAATLSSSVLQDVYYSRARNHESALAAALFGDNVPVSVYDNLLKAVHDNLETVYRYLALRRRALKLKELRAYDTYVPIVDMKRARTPYEKAADMVCDALEPLGDRYCKTLRNGLQGRWVDRFENEGKRSGAFSAGGYDGPPYILMNYKEDVLDSMFTLAHEAGHSMHTYYSVRNQPYQYYHYSIFVAEVASTFNEQLLNRRLLDEAKTKERRAYLINREIDEIRGTIIRQTMFAEFEKIIHAVAETGEPLTLERMREEYGKLLRLYFGPDFVIDEELSLECLRIPHFYSAFYVYKYATGLSAAIALSQSVLNGGQKDRERYLTFLQGGGSKYPLELLRDAGVDMESPEPVDQAMAHFKALVDELEGLL